MSESSAFEALDRLRTQATAALAAQDLPAGITAGLEVALAFRDLDAAVHLGRAIALLEHHHPCRACGTPAADCDQRYEDTLAELCCEVCEVGDTAELHDPAGAPWVDGADVDPDDEIEWADDDPRWKQ